MDDIDSRAPASEGAAPDVHEQAAHQKRNWVRLTYQCNDRCVFCLDADTHNGTDRDRDAIKRQILDGRRAGAERLILSGGEPTIHPDYIAFIRLGRAAGYERIQTVTNGRMFAYGDFLSRCLDAGLGEITFSIHGPNAKIHDALVGVQGAWAEEIRGLQQALADGRPIVNIDICVNRANVRHLPDMLRIYAEMGVSEFDLLQIIPFGRAFVEGRDTLFYDLEEHRAPIEAALAFAEREGIQLWMNRFPVEHLEGYESLIQDPYKLQDEVRGRKEEYRARIDHGIALDCREPDRCRYCYVSRLCDHVDDALSELDAAAFDVIRIDADWEAQQPAVYGGDPASAKRSLVVLGSTPPPVPTLAQRVRRSGATRLWIVAPDAEAARTHAERYPEVPQIELSLAEYRDAWPPTSAPSFAGRPVVRAHAASPDAAQRLVDAGVPEVAVALNRATAPWLLAADAATLRSVVVRQPSYARRSLARASDVDLPEFFAALVHPVASEDVPQCVLPSAALRAAARPRRRVLDTARLQPDGRLEIFRTTRRFIADRYRVKSRRCRACVHHSTCDGLHVNTVRAHGFSAMQPIAAPTR